MYLKSLELHGFKSFPDRTLLRFNRGATMIVGPNGSGKSNITDAMRWVLGELSTKNIRGSKMEDVIFAGASDRKPMSFAEVSVTFDDSEEPRSLQSPYDEVTVTRRYYRSGDSEYFINRKKCRLKDIYELFMNTGIGREGYSIIGQGRIAEIISKKSDERRGVFEESAGIARFRYKKTESEKKLAETEANMERVSDIEHELSLRIGPLEKDAAKARQYLELYGEKKKTDISLWMYDSERLKAAVEKAEGDTRLSAHELEMAEDSIRLTSSQIERLYEQSHSNKEASRRNYEETAAASRQRNDAESDAKLLAQNRLHAEANLKTERSMQEAADKTASSEEERLETLKERLGGITGAWNQAKFKCDRCAERLAELDGRIRGFNTQLDELLKDQKNAESVMTDLRVRLNVLEHNIANQKKQNESIRTDIQKYEAEIAQLDKTAETAEKQIADYRRVTEEIDGEISDHVKASSAFREEYAKIDSRRRSRQGELDSLDSRITAMTRMQEHFDGYNNSIKHIMNEARAGRLSGIRGPLSYLIKVQPQYIVAIETSLGAALQNIVTDDEPSTKRAIESLKRNNAGRATFYPITTVRGQERGRDYEGLERTAGFVGWGDDLVSCDEQYRNIVKSLLARVAVYNNIDTASDAARARGWRIRCVTLDGQQINAGGSFTGGQTKRDSGMLSRNAQIDSLTVERANVLAEMEEIRRLSSDASEKIAAEEMEISKLEERRGLIEALISAENKNFSDADGRRRALGELLSGMIADSRTLDETGRGHEDELVRMKQSIEDSKAKIAAIGEKRDEIAVLRGEDELEAASLAEQSADLRIRLAELTRDREAAEISISETEERLENAKNDSQIHADAVKNLDESIRTLCESAESRLKEAEEIRTRIEKLNEQRRKLEAAGDEIEKQISTLRQTEKEQTAKKEILVTAHLKNESKLNQLKADDQKLSASMWENYEMTYAAAVKFASENDCHVIADGERTSFAAKQNELKAKIRALGHVNVESIEEYTEVKKRFDYITAQLGDLRASREDLLKILDGIEDDMKKMFLEAFGKINTYFGEVFRELFGGGHAEVILTDPENALESGIEINAAPPGKTIKNLNLLSGGEQAFIAIALLFALIRVNPSPFCIFDEIEAALDEVNVTRLAKYVKKVSEEMQIIMITHRHGTMDVADTIYGITMQQSGVSKVMTITFDDKEEIEKLLK